MKNIVLALLSTFIVVNGYSQSVETAFFSLTQVGGHDSKIRSKSVSEIVSVSFSYEYNSEVFTFIKNADTMVCATVPSGYIINDFFVLDSCIFFCGKNVLNNCGYIGIFDVVVADLNIGGYKIWNIAETDELTEVVAYKVSDIFPIYGSLAVAKNQNLSYKTSVINLNNYFYDDYNYWKCGIGYEIDDYLTDVELVSNGASSELITIGQSFVLNSNQNNSVEVYTPKMYMRKFEKDAVFMSSLEDTLYTYTGIRMSSISPFKVTNLNNNNIAVTTVTSKSKLHQIISNEGIEIKMINLNNLMINGLQFVDNTSGTLKEVTYLTNPNKLVLLKESITNIDEIFFADLSKIEDYTSSKVYRNKTSFNSLFCYDNVHFLATGLEENTTRESLSLLQMGINNISTNECVFKESIKISTESKSISPANPRDPIPAFNSTIEFEVGFPFVYETDVNLKCLNYYEL